MYYSLDYARTPWKMSCTGNHRCTTSPLAAQHCVSDLPAVTKHVFLPYLVDYSSGSRMSCFLHCMLIWVSGGGAGRGGQITVPRCYISLLMVVNVLKKVKTMTKSDILVRSLFHFSNSSSWALMLKINFSHMVLRCYTGHFKRSNILPL